MKSVKPIRRHTKGLILILVMLFLAIFAALGTAFYGFTSLNMAQAASMSSVSKARLSAESGLSFMTYQLQNCGVSGSLRGQALLDMLAARLRTRMNGSANLAGSTIGYDNTAITIPTITFATGQSFSGRITLHAADALTLTVTGQHTSGSGSSAGTVQREVSMNFRPAWDQALGYGLVSKGRVEMGMNTTIQGVVQAMDGSVYSAASGEAVSFGSGHITGAVSVSDPSATVSLGGTQVDGGVIYNAPPVTMPTIDRTGYKSLATTIITSATPPAGTYKNIRIRANTNPTFNSAVTIQGVMYIESPNKVTFNNNVNFTGVMVADDPPTGSPDSANYIYFKNNMTFLGPEKLAGDEFAAIRKLQGASILCPGFTMEFKNNMDSVGGIMALKSLIAMNNISSEVLGSMLIYGSAGLDFKNNSMLDIWLSGANPPPGFGGHGLPPLLPVCDTYAEQ